MDDALDIILKKKKKKPSTAISSSFDNAFIDGDILAYKAAAATDGRHWVHPVFPNLKWNYKDQIEHHCMKKGADPKEAEVSFDPEPVKNTYRILDGMFRGLKDDVLADQYIPFISGEQNFREDLYPLYKENRKDKRRPKNLKKAKAYLVNVYGGKVVQGEEADDALAYSTKENDIICSIDKDLLQVPGYHYNLNTKKITKISKRDGDKNLYTQILIGDSTDNIPGLHKVGPKTAEKILKDSQDFFRDTLVFYFIKMKPKDGEDKASYTKRVLAFYKMNMQLVYLRRKKEEVWNLPTLSPETVADIQDILNDREWKE